MMRNYTKFKEKLMVSIRGIAITCWAMGSTLIAHAQLNGTYTIDQNSSASSTNFRSFTALASQMMNNTRPDGGPTLGAGVSGPVTINVVANSGPYQERFVITQINGANTNNTITINGNGNVLQYNNPVSGDFSAIYLNGAKWFRIRNLGVRINNTSQGWGIHFMNDASDNIIENCDIDISAVTTITTNAIGIVFSGSTTSPYTLAVNGYRNILRNNVIRGGVNGGPYFGIIQIQQSGSNNNNNLFEGNDIRDFSYYGFYINYTGGNTYRANRIHRPTRNLAGYPFYGMYLINGARRELIENNYIYNPYGGVGNGSSTLYGIYLATVNAPSSDPINIRNNVIQLNKTSGAVYGLGSTCGANINFHHNTVDIDNRGVAGSGVIYGVYAGVTCGFRFQEYYNNIIDIKGRTTNTIYGYFLQTSGGLGDFLINNNGIRITNASNGTIDYGNAIGTPHSTFAAWQAGNGRQYDQNSTDDDPLFTNPAALNYRPQSISHDDIGRNIGITTDITGSSRTVTSPDPGAFEFSVDVRATGIFTQKSLYCQNEIDSIRLTITNFSTITVPSLNVSYRVGTGTTVTERATLNIPPGQSRDYWFSTKHQFAIAGALPITGRVTAKRDSVIRNVTINAAPVGAQFVQGSPFNGQFLGGDVTDPDIVAHGDKITYGLQPATGFPNSGFGTQWFINNLDFRTLRGTPVLSSDTATFIPTMSANGRIEFTPSQSVSDSMYLITVRLINLTNGCIAPPITRQLFVAPRPTADFTASASCLGNPTIFQNSSSVSSGSLSYVWRFGNGDSSTLTNPVYTYPNDGVYTVELVARTNFGYTSVVSRQVTVVKLPEADFTFTNVCEGNAMPFINTSVAQSSTINYTWNFGDGNTSNAKDPNHTYSQPGVYQVSLLVDDNGCLGTKSSWVTNSPKPLADFTFSGSLCSNTDISFTNSSTISTGNIGFSWSFGDGGEAGDANPTHVYTNSGNFDVRLTVTSDFGCTDSKTQSVAVLPGPAVDFSFSDPCAGDPVSFTNNTAEPSGIVVNYVWDFGDGMTSTTKNPVHTFAAFDKYNVTLSAIGSNACSASMSKVVGTGLRPQARFIAPNQVCQGQAYEFTNSSLGFGESLSFSWSFGDGSTSTDANPVRNFTNSGDYNVVLHVVTPGGCSDSTTGIARVREVPSSTFTVESNKNGDGTVLIKPAQENDGQYVWNFSNGFTASNSSAFTYRFGGNALYSITLNRTKDGCSSTSTVDVRINILSVNEISLGGITLYPNPTSGNLNIRFETRSNTKWNAEVYDLAGKLLKAVNLNSDLQLFSIDLSEFSSGLYLVKMSNGTDTYQSRIELLK